MEKSRKKQRSMAIVAIVLMVCLVLALGTFTFAKYITSSSSGEQSATVANWDFTITVDTDQLFNDTYKIGEGETYATPKSTGSSISVKGSTADRKLLAPGASSSMTISINGKAETKSKLTISLKDGYAELKCDDYYPVVWTLNDGSTDLATGKLSDIENYLNGDSSAVTFDANTSVDKTYTLSWAWAYEGEGSDDEKDTAISVKANNTSKEYSEVSSKLDSSITEEIYDSIVATMSFELTISVEQVQQ